MDPDQTALDPHCLSMRLHIFKKNTFCDYALLGLINVSTVCIWL